MTTITGEVYLPYGPGGRTGADGCVSFHRRALTAEGGIVTLPGSVKAAVTGGVMEPVELAPGTWEVLVTVAGRAHGLGPFEVTGEAMRLLAGPPAPETPMPEPPAPEPPAPVPLVQSTGDGTYTLDPAAGTVTDTGDGTYLLTLAPTITLTDNGEGDYLIGENHG